MTNRVYLDWNATAPLRLEARDATVGRSISWATRHRSMAKDARRAIWSNRPAGRSPRWSEPSPSNVIFTSGGTEANMLALTPSAACGALLVSSIEHPSVLAGGRFDPAQVRQVPVNADGRLDLAALAQALEAAGRPVLVSLMARQQRDRRPSTGF